MQNWSSNTFDAATTETFVKAHMIVDGTGLDTLTTWTYGDCGEQGEFIHIPTEFMTADRSTIIDQIGYPGKLSLYSGLCHI